MKNLSLWNLSKKDLNLNLEDGYIVCPGSSDLNSEELYVLSNELVLTRISEDCEEIWQKDLSKVSSPESSPISLVYLTLSNCICVGLSNGELITVSDDGTKCDLAGVCEGGLLAMEWSPDQECLVLVTKELKSILMSCTFDPITESALVSEEFGEKQFITVGWGKKETQFHGSEGKAARVQAEVTADPNLSSEYTVKVSWRGDGNLYAVGFTMEGLRRFKVFDKEGHLQYTSEKQPGLESNLSWRPSGNVIATTQRLSDKYMVAFFEKNGLKHGGFDIPTNTTTSVKDIYWSSDSEIIMLHCEDTEVDTQKLLIFTTGNYHWYLKQVLQFNENQKIDKIFWDSSFKIDNHKKLHVFLNRQYLTYSWVWNIDHSEGRSEIDDAVVAVIDGQKVKLTGFRQTAIPPPIAALEIELEAPINSAHFASRADENKDSNTFFVITVDQKLMIYEQSNKFPLSYQMVKTFALEKYEFPFQYYNWHWLNYNTVLCTKLENDQSYKIIEYNIETSEIVKKSDEYLPAPVLRITSHPFHKSELYLQLNNGDIVMYSSGGMIEPQEVCFEQPCPRFDVFSIDDMIHFIGLAHNSHLYIDNYIIMNDVSSFFVHTHFLLLTTLKHVLLCAELTKSSFNGLLEHSKNESSHVYKRKIERGAKLVIAVPENTRTVFQMPRGNLETIQPRPLTLKIIGKYLDWLRYHEAFDLMRKERINLNLIYDHNPQKFTEHIGEFLESIQNNSWLSLFLSELDNVDVTQTMYSSSYADRNNTVICTNNSTKVIDVCNTVRHFLKQRSDVDNRIFPIITSYVKTNIVTDLEEALKIIKELKERETKGAKLPVSSDEALKYLLYMVDVSNLFDIALGMYDFDLVLLVANKSQKDPKEYLAMLKQFNEMEENYKRFSINKHLKRFNTAVEYLVKCGPEKYEELRSFVKYHSLYGKALSLFKPEEEIFKQIAEDFGLHLKLQKQYTAAGVIYQRGSNIDKAIECYKEALDWEMAINLAYLWPIEKFQDLCSILVSLLQEEKRHSEALTILEQFNKNKEGTIMYAISCGHYKTALRICTQYERNDLKDGPLLETVLADHKNLKELIETNASNFKRHKERLRIVREIKKTKPIENYDPSFENKDCDLYSDAGSTAASSRGSSRSYRSSKNKRKHERKVASLKEGSQYEDVALVIALYGMVTSTFELRTLVKEVNVVLSLFGRDTDAFDLQISLEKLLKEMKESFREIWTHQLVLEATNASIAAESLPEGGPVLPQGLASLEPHMRIAPVIKEANWKLEGLF